MTATTLKLKPLVLMMLTCFILAGCESTMGAGIASPEQLRDTMNARFVGGPVQTVIQRYGMPDSQYMYGNIRVIEWHAHNALRFHETITTTSTGRIGDSSQSPWYASIPYRETTTSSVGHDVNYTCTMQVGVRQDGTVDAIGFNGKMGGCTVFMP